MASHRLNEGTRGGGFGGWGSCFNTSSWAGRWKRGPSMAGTRSLLLRGKKGGRVPRILVKPRHLVAVAGALALGVLVAAGRGGGGGGDGERGAKYRERSTVLVASSPISYLDREAKNEVHALDSDVMKLGDGAHSGVRMRSQGRASRGGKSSALCGVPIVADIFTSTLGCGDAYPNVGGGDGGKSRVRGGGGGAAGEGEGEARDEVPAPMDREGVVFPGEFRSPAGELDSETWRLIRSLRRRLLRSSPTSQGTEAYGGIKLPEDANGRSASAAAQGRHQQEEDEDDLSSLCAVPVVADALEGVLECGGASGRAGSAKVMGGAALHGSLSGSGDKSSSDWVRRRYHEGEEGSPMARLDADTQEEVEELKERLMRLGYSQGVGQGKRGGLTRLGEMDQIHRSSSRVGQKLRGVGRGDEEGSPSALCAAPVIADTFYTWLGCGKSVGGGRVRSRSMMRDAEGRRDEERQEARRRRERRLVKGEQAVEVAVDKMGRFYRGRGRRPMEGVQPRDEIAPAVGGESQRRSYGYIKRMFKALFSLRVPSWDVESSLDTRLRCVDGDFTCGSTITLHAPRPRSMPQWHLHNMFAGRPIVDRIRKGPPGQQVLCLHPPSCGSSIDLGDAKRKKRQNIDAFMAPWVGQPVMAPIKGKKGGRAMCRTPFCGQPHVGAVKPRENPSARGKPFPLGVFNGGEPIRAPPLKWQRGILPPPPPAPAPSPPAPKARPWKCTGPFCTPIRFTGIDVKDPFDDVHVRGHLHPWMYKDIAGGQTLRSTQGAGGEGKGGRERGKRRGMEGSDSGAGVAEKVEGWE